MILCGAFVVAMWGAWRPRYHVTSYLVAGAVVAALIAVLVATGQTNIVIVSAFQAQSYT
jgi:uncharacterized membrane protein YraQ (UPF0718 family)